MSEPYVEWADDGRPVVVVPATEEQIRREEREREFHRCMRLLKANNGNGSMTSAMWLLYEEAHYSQGYSDTYQWGRYLKKLEEDKIVLVKCYKCKKKVDRQICYSGPVDHKNGDRTREWFCRPCVELEEGEEE